MMIIRSVPIFLLLLAMPAWAEAAAMMATVTGTVDDPGATVTVNGVNAAVSGATFTASNVPLTFGPNTIVAIARDAAGNQATKSMSVEVSARFTIRGTVDDATATMTVNGVTATVASGQFTAAVPLRLGLNTLTATARDQAGNTSNKAAEAYVVRPPVDHP